jgi:hypothetical protein
MSDVDDRDETVILALSAEGVAEVPIDRDHECQCLGGSFMVHRYSAEGSDGDPCACGQTRRGETAVTDVYDLVAFVRQQLDEEERHAQKDLHVLDRATGRGEWTGYYGHNLPYSEVWADGGILFRIEGPRHEADVMAVARMVKLGRQRALDRLAEVKAKRQILDEHDSYGGYGERCQTCRDPNDDLAAGAPLPCPTVRLLAQPYAGRPGWREEWAV